MSPEIAFKPKPPQQPTPFASGALNYILLLAGIYAGMQLATGNCSNRASKQASTTRRTILTIITVPFHFLGLYANSTAAWLQKKNYSTMVLQHFPAKHTRLHLAKSTQYMHIFNVACAVYSLFRHQPSLIYSLSLFYPPRCLLFRAFDRALDCSTYYYTCP